MTTADLANDLQGRWRLVQGCAVPADLEPIAFDFLLGIEDLTERLELFAGAGKALTDLLHQAWRIVDEATLPAHLQPAAFRFAARELFAAAGGQVVRTSPGGLLAERGRLAGPSDPTDVRPGPGRDDVGHPGI